MSWDDQSCVFASNTRNIIAAGAFLKRVSASASARAFEEMRCLPENVSASDLPYYMAQERNRRLNSASRDIADYFPIGAVIDGMGTLMRCAIFLLHAIVTCAHFIHT